MTEPKKKILVVEDEQDIVEMLLQCIRPLGFDVDTARDGESGLSLASGQGYDLIVLDVGLPGLGGFEVCKKLRAQQIHTPILMVTARADEIDKVLGLELGADDYVVKPFSIREVEARISALLRRSRLVERSTAAEADSDVCFAFGPLQVFPGKHLVMLNGNPLQLTALEYRLLFYFVDHAGVTITRDRLLHDIWGYDVANYGGTVTSHVSRLRMKIEPNPLEPIFIKTVHGIGYQFAKAEDFA